MKVMARVDDIVPKIALVGDEEGTLLALDVASGEILCNFDAEKSSNAITTIESYAVSDTSDINSSGDIASGDDVVKVEAVTKKWSRRESSWGRRWFGNVFDHALRGMVMGITVARN